MPELEVSPCEPPPIRRHGATGEGPWWEFVATVLATPGQWFQTTSSGKMAAGAAAQRLRGSGRSPLARPGQIEATSRGAVVYARTLKGRHGAADRTLTHPEE